MSGHKENPSQFEIFSLGQSMILAVYPKNKKRVLQKDKTLVANYSGRAHEQTPTHQNPTIKNMYCDRSDG
jgi:hypothetical protein